MGIQKQYRKTVDAVTGEISPATGATTFTIALAASGTTNGMDVTITAKDGKGNTVAAPTPVSFWMSNATTGIGLTASAYSGAVTATTGAFLTVLTAKKQFSAVTAATGILAFTIIDTVKPATEYVAIEAPSRRSLVVSGASGTNWL